VGGFPAINVNSVQFNTSGDTVAAGCMNGTVQIIDVATAEVKRPLSGHSFGVYSVCWNNGGTKLSSGSSDKTVKVWDPTTGECLWTLNVDGEVLSVAYSPDGTKLTAGLGYPSNSVVVFDTQTNEQICSLRGHTDVVGSVCFSSDGKLTSGSEDSTARNWSPATRASLS
jgi:WD40 repeat protein